MTTDSITVFLATGLGMGYLPIAPGTAGGLAGVMLAVLLARLKPVARLLIVFVLISIAIPVCEVGARHFAGKDDPRIVADELLTFPVATAALPSLHPAVLVGVFVTSRVLDIAKPFPAAAAERLPGGIGIVLDDVVANLWTLLLWLVGMRVFKTLYKRYRP